MKRFLALLAALVMLAGVAFAQDVSAAPIASYVLPVGAEALHLRDTTLWDIPEGLELMYALMQHADPNGNVYLARMANGRALVSVACSTPKTRHTAQELKEMWLDIAKTIAAQGVTLEGGDECAVVEECFGFEALRIKTTIWLANDIALNAVGTAFYRGDELLEVWAVAPVAGTYTGEEEAEWQKDCADMVAFLDSLNFVNNESDKMEGVAYFDPDGRFALLIPKDCTVITRHSTQQEVEAARAAYVAAHEDGAQKMFDEYMENVTDENVVLLIAGDQSAVVEVFASQTEDFRDVTPDQLRQLAVPIRQSLAERFDIALLLSADQRAVISGKEHAHLTYWLRSGEVNTQLDILAAVLDDAWLYEVDLYVHDGDQNVRSLWQRYLVQSTVYTPLVNALD